MDISALLAGLPPGAGDRIRSGETDPADGGEAFALALRAAAGGRGVDDGDPRAGSRTAPAGEKPAALTMPPGAPLAGTDSNPLEITGGDSGNEERAAEVDSALWLPLAAAADLRTSPAPLSGEPGDSATADRPLERLAAAAPLAQRALQEAAPRRDMPATAEPPVQPQPDTRAGGAGETTAPAADTRGAAPKLTRAEGPAVPAGAAAEPLSQNAPSTAAPAAVSGPPPGNHSGPASPAAPALSPSLQAPLASQPWGQELGQQLLGLVQRGEEQVELQLNPRELGPLSVSLTLDDQGARAQFWSAQAAVRGAVEQAIPQLRDALAQQGIALGEATVGEQQQQQRRAPTAWDYAPGNRTSDGETAADSVPPRPSSQLSAAPADRIGGVDLYA